MLCRRNERNHDQASRNKVSRWRGRHLTDMQVKSRDVGTCEGFAGSEACKIDNLAWKKKE